MLERQWQTQVQQLATRYGWKWYHAPRAGDRRARTLERIVAGWPDLVLLKAPRVIFVELKTDDRKSKPSPEQVEWLRGLEACGQEVGLWRPSDLPLVLQILGPRGHRAKLPEKLG